MSDPYATALTALSVEIYQANVEKGWWKDSLRFSTPAEGGVPDKYLIPAKMALMHSEISEALEGHRKNLADDKLSQYPMEAVEYADTIIRILDACGYQGYDIGTIVQAKREFNAIRPDHTLEVRMAAGGKSI